MPYTDVLCSWLVRSALVSLTILLIGSGAVLMWRQPARRVRIIELVLAGCLIAPLLEMIPSYPQLSVVWWHAAERQEAPLPHPEPMTEPAMMEPTIPEPMPFPTVDRATPPLPSTKTIEAPVHAFEIRPWIVGIYLTGVAIGIGWWLVGIVGLARILRTSQPAPSRCRELLTEISGRRGGRVRLLVSRRLSQPFASAWGRAVIVLPENLCGDESHGSPRLSGEGQGVRVRRHDEQALRWCLAHEWAHIDGHDFRTWLLAGLARLLFFYQPLLWWLRRQLRLCQDFIADSQAARQAPQVEDYAEFLTARASGRLQPALGLSMGCRKSELYRRVIMLLKNQPLESRTPRLWTVSITMAALVLVAVVAAVSLAPRAVAEEKPNTNQGGATAEIEKLGGKVFVDKKYADKPVIAVDLTNTKVTDAGLTCLEGLNHLQTLLLDGSQVADVGLEHLKALTNLRTLDLSHTQVTDAGLKHIKALTNLQGLVLVDTQVTDAGLEHIKALSNLQVLSLGRTRVTDAGLEHLKVLTKLQTLVLVDTQVTDAGLEYLKALTNLQGLALAGTQVTNAGLEKLRAFTNLTSLFLDRTRVTDAGLEYLKGLTELRILSLGGTKVTDSGVQRLQQTLPNCIIRRKIADSAASNPAPAVPKANDQSGKTAAAKPAAEVSPASDQTATKAVAEAKFDAARAKAEDDINVRYAIAAAAVVKAEYEVNKEASDNVPGSVPPEKLNELSLKCKEYDLAVEKARLDQRIASEEAKIAKAEFEATKFPDDHKAQLNLDVAKAEARYNVARAKAEDDINVRYAIAAAAVAKAEHETNKERNHAFPGSVPKVRINELLLKCKEADLAVEKARHEQRNAANAANVARAEFEEAQRKAANLR